MCTALVIGNTIGMGIFLQPASLAPYGYNALIAWAITIFGTMLLALIFASLARRMAQADGPYEYVRATQGDGVAFLAMWSYWVSVWVTNAALAVGVVGYLTAVLPALGSVPPVLVAVGLIWLFVFVNLLGVRTGGGVQIVTTVLKLIPMAVIIGLGLWTLLVDPSAYTQNLPTTPVTMPSILAASAIVLYAMLGIESAAVPAGQVHDPERTIPRATIAGTLITALVYVGRDGDCALHRAPGDAGRLERALRRSPRPASGRRRRSLARVLRRDQRARLPERLDHAGRRHDPLVRSAGIPAGGDRAVQPVRGASRRADRDGRARERACADELQQVAGGRIYVPHDRHHGRQPAAVPLLRAGPGGDLAPRSRRACLVRCSGSASAARSIRCSYSSASVSSHSCWRWCSQRPDCRSTCGGASAAVPRPRRPASA